MRYLKNKFLLTIIYLENEEGKLKVTDSINIKCKAKDFEDSIAQNPKMPIEFVNEKPIKFKLGVLYVLKDGTKVWTWQLNG